MADARAEVVWRYEQEVLACLYKWLVEERKPPISLTGSGYPFLIEELRSDRMRTRTRW
jgi:hypothetical protein